MPFSYSDDFVLVYSTNIYNQNMKLEIINTNTKMS